MKSKRNGTNHIDLRVLSNLHADLYMGVHKFSTDVVLLLKIKKHAGHYSW